MFITELTSCHVNNAKKVLIELRMHCSQIWVRDSSVGRATRYGMDGPGIESRWGEIFRTSPDRPWGPPILLHNGYWVFPGGEAAGAWRRPPTPSSAEVKERVELHVHLLHLWAFVTCYGLTFAFTILQSDLCCLSVSCCEAEWARQLMQCYSCTHKVYTAQLICQSVQCYVSDTD